MANINTLVKDIQDTILGLKGWDNVLGLKMGHNIAKSAFLRFNKPQKARGYLSFSSIGSPCKRKLWYKINHPQESKQPDASDLIKFFYGDIIEELILVLAQVAGHEVTGQQDRLKIAGLAGHRDAVIDGMTVDVKSASPYGITKFVDSSLRDNDPFGYISQLSSYVYAAQNDPLVTNKTHGAFLVVNILINASDSENIYEWGGLAKDSPITGIFSVIFFFSLAGIPPLGGWFAKFVVFRSLLSTGEIFGLSLGVVGAINAVIALVYYARISKIIWMDDSPAGERVVTVPNTLKVVGFISLALTVLAGIFPGIFSNLGEASAIFFSS